MRSSRSRAQVLVSTARLTPDQRTGVIIDLLNLDFPLEEIIDKYDVGIKTIYNVARRFGLNMNQRNRIVKMRAEHERLTLKIKAETEDAAQHFQSDDLAEKYLNGLIDWDGNEIDEYPCSRRASDYRESQYD